MAEPLKNFYGPEIPHKIADMIGAVHPEFDREGFLAAALAGYQELELTPRARHLAEVMARYLPANFEEAARILGASLGPPLAGDELVGQGMAPFVYLPHVFWVAERGLDHWETAMELQHALTQRFSCEYSIRFFIEREPERTLARLREWTGDPNAHVRRLVSEGTRPRLPWAPRLTRFQEDPSPVLDLLERLKDDPTTLVRRSVANNLNDIGKDHPGLLVEVCRRWLTDATPEREALVRHALRSAVKRGDPGALELLGFGAGGQWRVENVAIDPPTIAIGEQLRLGLDLVNTTSDAARYNVDLIVHFVKANGSTGPKVFKLRQLRLEGGQRTRLTKTISFAQHTTRTHYPGLHLLEIFVNGASQPIGSVMVEEAL